MEAVTEHGLPALALVLNNAVQEHGLQCEYSTVYRCTVQYTGVQYSVQVYSIVYRCTVQCTSVQYSVQMYSIM